MNHLRRCSLLVSISFTMIVYGCTAPPADHFDNQAKETGAERSAQIDLALSSSHEIAAAVANQLRDPSLRAKAERKLIQMGPSAESSVLPFLKNPQWEVRLSACKILAAIGTQESIPALQDLSGAEHNSLVNEFADKAVEQIRNRIGNSH